MSKLLDATRVASGLKGISTLEDKFCGRKKAKDALIGWSYINNELLYSDYTSKNIHVDTYFNAMQGQRFNIADR